MTAKSVFAAAALAAWSASAFRLQVGVSGSYGDYLTTDYFAEWSEIGATPGYVVGQYVNGVVALGERWGVKLPDSGTSLALELDGMLGGGLPSFAVGETVAFGGVRLMGSMVAHYVVATARGTPYSLVHNATGRDRTFNGVFIADGEGAWLPLPLVLSTDGEIPGAEFHDLDTGVELTPSSSGGGTYALYWTGNIRVGGSDREASVEPLVYGGLAGAGDGKLLHSATGAPIYSDPVNLETNIELMTWWDYSPDDWGGSTEAYIDDDCVCATHTTGHIVTYNVSTSGAKAYRTGGYCDFTMSLVPEDGYSGGACTMRCWDSSVQEYDDAPPAHRAEVSAGDGAAGFRVRVYADGSWTLTAL